MVMSKKRIVLFSILGCMLISMILSVVGVIPNRFAVLRDSEVGESYRERPYTSLLETSQGGAQVSQRISNFYLPSYNESGEETFTLLGREAVLVNDRVYKITRPEIHLKPDAKDMDVPETQEIVITAKRGKMDRLSNIGILTKDVVVRLGGGTTLKTERLVYYTEQRRATTDSPVTIQGERMNVKGVGMEAELLSGRMWIESSVVAEVKGARSNLFVVSMSGGDTEEDRPRRVYIHCKGKMVFEKEPNMVTFHEDVRVRRGGSTMRSDKLVIIFDKDNDKPKMIVAEGDVTATDGKKVAKGDSLFWDAVTDATTLEGIPNATFFEEKISLVAPKIVFRQKEDRVDALKGGQLVTKGFEDEAPEDGMLGSGNVTITWKDRMRFEKGKGNASFEKDVLLSRKDFKMNSQRLVVGFRQGLKVKTLVATGGTYMVEKRGGILREVYGDEARWDIDTGLIEILGEGTLYIQGKEGDEEGLTNISWTRKMVRDEKNKKISFFENVLALKGQHQVECNKLNAFINEKNEVHRIVALGDVVYSDTKEGGIEGIGDMLEWDWRQNKMILSGTPTAEVRRRQARTFAKRVYYDPETQRLSWREKPRWQIPLQGRDVGKTIPLTPY